MTSPHLHLANLSLFGTTINARGGIPRLQLSSIEFVRLIEIGIYRMFIYSAWFTVRVVQPGGGGGATLYQSSKR